MTTPPKRHPVVARTPLPSRPAPGTASGPAPKPAGPLPTGPAPVEPTPAPGLGSPAPVDPHPGPAPADPVPVEPAATPVDVEPAPESGPLPTPSLAAGDVVDLDTGEVIEGGVEDEQPTEPLPSTTVHTPPSMAAAPSVSLDVVTEADVATAENTPPTPIAHRAPVGLPSAPRVSTSVDTWRPPVTDGSSAVALEVVNLDPDADDTDAPGAPVATGNRRKGTKLTDRDLSILRFITRYRYVTYAQLVQQFGINAASLRRRLPKLEREGLVKSVRASRTLGVLWRITEDGTVVCNLPIDAPKKIAWSTVAHTLGIVDLGIQFEEAGELVVTEAEIRAADTRNVVSDRMEKVMGQGHRRITNAPIFAIGAGSGNGGRTGLHVPDMVLARPENPKFPGQPQSLAIELELRRKAPSRVRQVLLAYRKAPNIGAVVYFTHDPQVRDLIRQCAADTNTTDIVDVRRWEPSDAMGLVE